MFALDLFSFTSLSVAPSFSVSLSLLLIGLALYPHSLALSLSLRLLVFFFALPPSRLSALSTLCPWLSHLPFALSALYARSALLLLCSPCSLTCFPSSLGSDLISSVTCSLTSRCSLSALHIPSLASMAQPTVHLAWSVLMCTLCPDCCLPFALCAHVLPLPNNSSAVSTQALRCS